MMAFLRIANYLKVRNHSLRCHLKMVINHNKLRMTRIMTKIKKIESM
jgi:hypothetical protein